MRSIISTHAVLCLLLYHFITLGLQSEKCRFNRQEFFVSFVGPFPPDKYWIMYQQVQGKGGWGWQQQLVAPNTIQQVCDQKYSNVINVVSENNGGMISDKMFECKFLNF